MINIFLLQGILICYFKFFQGLHKCGCKSGLTCQPVFSIGSLPIYHRCKPAPTEEPGSGDLQ